MNTALQLTAWHGGRGQLRLAIEDVLDGRLPKTYTPEFYHQKCAAVFEHVFESYYGEGAGVYANFG